MVENTMMLVAHMTTIVRMGITRILLDEVWSLEVTSSANEMIELV